MRSARRKIGTIEPSHRLSNNHNRSAHMTFARLVTAYITAAFFPAIAQPSHLPIDRIKLPPGFEISIFAENVKNARSMALGDQRLPGGGGTLFVGTMRAGAVYAIRHDGRKATEVITIASGLNMPNGVAVKGGALYVAEVSRVIRYDDIEVKLPKAPDPVVVYDKFPRETHHGWKFLAFGPDGWLYVPVGAPCNICERPEPYSAITRLKVGPGSAGAAPSGSGSAGAAPSGSGSAGAAPSGSGSDTPAMEVFAKGVRNSVGFDWHPETKELWFTDNGRDMMGDDVPPDELNHAPRAGMHFGYPYCHGGDIADPQFGKDRPCSEFTPPAKNFGAHVASLGMRFYTGSMFPAEYRQRIFIAEHGSWNRSRKSGYRVMQAKVAGGKVVEHGVFAEGFLDSATDSAWGRPVDVLVMPDGALLVSDDHAGAIYRISYRGR
jgi:glucose/arabinose dehydrogenase